jgi:TolB-like protein
MPSNADRLDSWKEIAAYLNRSVRTARRWEREEGLPVHRHVHNKLGSVYAHRSEIEAWRAAAGVTASAPRSSVRSIAVLPFQNLGGPDQSYFAEGLTDEVTTALSAIRALRVISQTSARATRGSAGDVKQIAAGLEVQYVVEGSVRRSGNRLRITAQLIDAAADSHLWADTLDGTTDDVFAFQERIARVIVEALQLTLTPDEEQRLAARPIENVAAYECYLRARQESYRWRKDAIDHSIQLLQNGLAIIGDNAHLWASLGVAWLQYREAGIDFGDGPLREAERCVARVFAIEPTSPSGLQLRGWIHYARGRVQEAVRDLKAALERDAGNADTILLLANCYLISGRVQAARPLIERLVAIDPLTPLTRCMPAFADIMEGKLADAAEPYRQMLEMDPANPMARLFCVWVLVLRRDIQAAAAVANAFPVEVRPTIPAQIAMSLANATSGDLPAIESSGTVPDMFARFLAGGFALAGMRDQAIHWLQTAVDRGFINYPFLAEHDPTLAPLRSDARFHELLERVRARWERFEA